MVEDAMWKITLEEGAMLGFAASGLVHAADAVGPTKTRRQPAAQWHCPVADKVMDGSRVFIGA